MISASTNRARRMLGVGWRLTASGLALAVAAPAFGQAVQPSAPTTTAPQPGEDVTPASETAGTQEVVVTGSRIARRDFEANSPIVTVGDALLEQSATTEIASNLNKLPQFTPANARTPTTSGGDIQPTARNTPGSTAVSLRGIGTNRTLVLINGRRATPADATGTVDINTIPSAAVERVEIISGGASSTYGADAVSGVTNFIMRSRFNGLEIDAQTGITERGDNFEYQVSGIMGANFAEDRGNISIAFSANERKPGYNRNRPWYRQLWADPNVGGSGFIPSPPGVNLNVALNNPANTAVLNRLIPGAVPTIPGQGTTVYVNPDGSIFTGFDRAGRGGRGDSLIINGYNQKALNNGQIGQNFVDSLTVSPLTRYNAFVQGNYEITEGITFFMQGNFSNNSTNSIQEAAPVTGGWSALIPYNSAAPQASIPNELRQVLNSRVRPNDPFQLQYLLPFPRTSSGDVYSYNLTAGFKGAIPGIDWTYELFGSQGKTQSSVIQQGFGSLERLRAVMAFGDFGQGFRQQGNAVQGGFGASTATCTTGFHPFTPGPVSEDCFEAIRADVKTRSEMHQTIWEGNVQGKVFDLPAGELRSALGATYRSNNYVFENDTLTTQGRSFLDQALGLYPAGNSAGKINVKEVYGELLIPLIHNTPFIKELSLELGGRISDYNTTGKSYTYKALGDWKITDWARVRGGYNRAERAPNVAELFLAPEQTFAAAPGGDVCSRLNLQAWSANPARNPNAARVEALCRVLMVRSSGDPSAPTQYYDLGAQPVGGINIFPTLFGNGNLVPEKADTYTAGIVLSSPFQNDFLRRLRFTVDYYKISVKDAIGAQSADIAQRQCFDTAFNPTLSADSPFCNGIINRNTGGGLGNVITTFLNNGRFRTSGIDFQLDWNFPVGPGRVNINAIVNKLLYTKSAELAVLPLIDFKGTLGPNQNGLNGGSYSYRVFATAGYTLGPASLSLQWRHLPSIAQEAQAINPTTNTIGGFPKYNLFNLIGSLSITRDISLRGGVENLFDKAPPRGGVNSAANLSLGQLPGGGFNAVFYDIIGRRYYFGAKAKF